MIAATDDHQHSELTQSNTFSLIAIRHQILILPEKYARVGKRLKSVLRREGGGRVRLCVECLQENTKVT